MHTTNISVRVCVTVLLCHSVTVCVRLLCVSVCASVCVCMLKLSTVRLSGYLAVKIKRTNNMTYGLKIANINVSFNIIAALPIKLPEC